MLCIANCCLNLLSPHLLMKNFTSTKICPEYLHS